MNNILVVSEYFYDAADRYAGIAAEIRKCLSGCRLSGLFFLPSGSEGRAVDIPGFDSLRLFSSLTDAKLVGNQVNADLLICLLHHAPSMTDMTIYRASRRIAAQRHLYTFRSVPLLSRAISEGISQEREILKQLAKALKSQIELYAKIVLFSSLVFLAAPFLKAASRKSDEIRPLSILVIKLDYLGDMIVNMPYFFQLKRHFHGSSLSILASSRGAAVLKEQALLKPELFDELIVWDAPWHYKRSLLGFGDLYAFLRKLPGLRRKHYDLVLHPLPIGAGTALAALLSGKRTFSVVNPALPLSRLMGRLISDPLSIDSKKIYHMEDFSRMIAGSLGVETIPLAKLSFSTADAENVAMITGSADGRARVLLNVGAGNRIREWGEEKFAGLASQLVRDGKKVILVGGSGDRATASAIQTIVQNSLVVDTTGRFTLNELAALMSASEAIVTVDTGTMHLAAAMELKTVAIFGAGLIPYCHPLGVDHVIVNHELGCSGCVDHCFVEGYPPCLQMVTVEEVYSALTNLLSRVEGIIK